MIINNLNMKDLQAYMPKLAVFTNEEKNPRTDCDWSWLIYIDKDGYGELVAEDNGMMKLCYCSACGLRRKEIEEFYSLYLALDAVKESKLQIPVTAYVSSGSLPSMVDDFEVFNEYLDYTNSCQLQNISCQFDALLEELDVTIVRHDYENKDILPSY